MEGRFFGKGRAHESHVHMRGKGLGGEWYSIEVQVSVHLFFCREKERVKWREDGRSENKKEKDEA